MRASLSQVENAIQQSFEKALPAYNNNTKIHKAIDSIQKDVSSLKQAFFLFFPHTLHDKVLW